MKKFLSMFSKRLAILGLIVFCSGYLLIATTTFSNLTAFILVTSGFTTIVIAAGFAVISNILGEEKVWLFQ